MAGRILIRILPVFMTNIRNDPASYRRAGCGAPSCLHGCAPPKLRIYLRNLRNLYLPGNPAELPVKQKEPRRILFGAQAGNGNRTHLSTLGRSYSTDELYLHFEQSYCITFAIISQLENFANGTAHKPVILLSLNDKEKRC